MTKRIIAMLLCALMILSMIPVMAISTSAAADGMWNTHRFASEYDDPDEEPDPNEEPSVYKPEAGYTYTSEGFTLRNLLFPWVPFSLLTSALSLPHRWHLK